MKNPLSAIQTSTEPLTRGHKKKERTRKKLIDSAIQLLSERDVGDLTLYGLAEAAEVSNGTVYNYFATREDVLDAVAIELAGQFSAVISELSDATESGAERVSIGVRMYIQRAQADGTWARSIVRLFSFHQGLNSAALSFIMKDVQKGMDAQEFDIPNLMVALETIIATGIAGIRSVIEGRLEPNGDEQFAFLVLRALGVPKQKALKIASKPLPMILAQESAPEAPKKRGRPKKSADI